METVCSSCGSYVAGKAPFCASCGAPQIRVPVREAAVEEVPQAAPVASQAPSQPVAPPPVLLRVGELVPIHWKTFFRIALPLAAVVGVSQVFYPPLTLLLLPGSVIIAIQLYRRRQPVPLRPAQGAKMGAFTGLVSFAVYALIFVINVATDPAGFRQQVAALIQEAISRNPTPEARQMVEAMFSGTGGLVFFFAIGMVFLLGLLLVLGSVSGALAARISREKTP